MIEASRYVAESRNALSEESELEKNNELLRETLTLTRTGGVQSRDVAAMIILCDEVSIFVANIVDEKETPIAQINGKKLYSKIYQDDVGNIVVTMTAPVPEHLLLQFMKIIDSFQAVFILAISSSSQILSSTAEGSLKYIATSKLAKAIKSGNAEQSVKFKNINEFSSKLAAVQQLGSGTVITGISAAIISYCEGHSIPAVSLLYSRRAGITMTALKMFDNVLPLLHATLKSDISNNAGSNSGSDSKSGSGGDSHVEVEVEVRARPTQQQYKAFVARDPFTNRTENVYT
jgi:hypothetical protein